MNTPKEKRLLERRDICLRREVAEIKNIEWGCMMGFLIFLKGPLEQQGKAWCAGATRGKVAKAFVSSKHLTKGEAAFGISACLLSSLPPKSSRLYMWSFLLIFSSTTLCLGCERLLGPRSPSELFWVF